MQEVHPRSLQNAYRREMASFVANGAVARLWAKDFTLWPHADGAKKRDVAHLDWLDLPQRMPEYMPRVVARARELESSPFKTLVFVGMGASNLAAETLARMSVSTRGRRFVVFDSIDPAAVERLANMLDWPTTLFVFANKSGKLIELHALLLYFLERLRTAGISKPGQHFIAVTEPNSYLAQLAAEYRFHDVFFDPPGISGRFSSLIHFDLLLSAIGRVEAGVLTERAVAMQNACGPKVAADQNPALTLAAFLAGGTAEGLDRLFLAATPSLTAVACSLAQLVGSSTGKNRQGIVPILGEIPCEHEQERPLQRCMVTVLSRRAESDGKVAEFNRRLNERDVPSLHIQLDGPEDVGPELYKWQLATVLACARAGVNPFDQPDAQRSRDAARKRIADLATTRDLPLPTIRVSDFGIDLRAEGATRQEISTHNLSEAFRTFLELRTSEGYFAILAFLEENMENREALVRMRSQLEARIGIPVQFSFGPRYLHFLGQVYKGGPAKGLFVILTAEAGRDVPVPGAGYTFGRLQTALAMGDFETLHLRDERVLWLHFGADLKQGLERLEGAAASALARLRQIA